VRVALFAPWPPQRSGIADYSYRLAVGLLEKNVGLDVFTAANSPTALEGCAIHSMSAGSKCRIEPDAFPVFQLGNNVSFHAFQPAALARLGGLVQLHDPVLHHFHVDRTLAAGNGGYWEDLEFWYGPAVARACRRLLELGAPPWSNAAVTAIPFFEPYLQFADAVLVHSQSALRTVQSRMPALRGYCLPQCYPLDPPPRASSAAGRPLRLGVFGWVEPHKRVDQILAAIAELRRRGADVRLDICGHARAGTTARALVDQIDALGLSSVVQLRGHVEHERFVSEIAGVDVCVNLRDPTMGETSAIVTQAMQLGTPVIVTDTGWYAELPDFVLKVPAGPGAADALVTHLARLDADRQFLASLAGLTRRYASTELDFAVVIGRYIEILTELSGERSRRRIIDDGLYRNVATALSDLGLAGSPQEEAMAAGIMDTLSACL
jgi:glycosyltransferase involved in cell wall biosynthesis